MVCITNHWFHLFRKLAKQSEYNFQTPVKSLRTAQGKIFQIFISQGDDFVAHFAPQEYFQFPYSHCS